MTEHLPGETHASERPGAAAGPRSLVGLVLSERYRIGRLLGEGGMGAVYEAEHLLMHKRLAIKVLHPDMSRVPEVVARFEREAMASGHIDHPNVASATDFGKLEDGSFFLVLELVEGKTLRAEIDDGRLEVKRALHILQQIAAPLVRAHGMGIVHRDLKPENVMLVDRDGDRDFVKVLDFGIAKVPVAEIGDGANRSNAAVGASKPALTQLGMIYGTPEYMAPEQALGGTIDGRADLYALGIIGYEMLTGHRPFEGDGPLAIIGMHVTAPVPPMSAKAPEAAIAPNVEALVRRLLAKEPSDRHADAKELLDEIQAVLTGGAMTQHPVARLAASAPDEWLGETKLVAHLDPRQEPAAQPGTGVRHSAVGALWRLVVGELATARRGAEPAVRSVVAKLGPRGLRICGAGVGGVALLVAGLAVFSGARGGAGGAAGPFGLALAASSAPSVAGNLTLDEHVAAATRRLAQGDAAGTIQALLPLEAANVERADIHHALERAYTLVHRPTEAMREADLWLAREPAAAADAQLGDDVRAAAHEAETATAAFALLERRMGAFGADDLYDMAHGPSAKAHPQTAERARRSLASPEVRAHASPALEVALALRAARSCEARKALLTPAAEVGDVRALPALKPLAATTGCGFLHLGDCYPCLRRDNALSRALVAIDERTKP